MGTLKEKFEELSAGIKASGKPAAAWFPKYTSTSLLNADNWWEALAVCEYALDTREDEKLTEGFFELIFSAFDCNVEVDLNEEEYEFWWEKVMRVCERVAVFSGAGWAQKGAQYSEARYGKRDMSYLFPCYEKAADMGWGEAEATVAYWRYMGFYCEQDKEEGDRLRAHVYAAMGDALDRGEGKIAEEAACYEKSLEIVPNLYSLKNLATLYFRYPELGKPKELAFEIWEKAWHAGVWSAANFLGYNYQEEAWLDLPKAIEWLEKGMLYCELYSAYELALIYLYNDDYKNVERGLMCLERCVEGDYIEGIEGLANVYFNGDLVEEDMSRVKQLLEKALELGSGNAAYRLGWMYERGFLSEEPDYVKAMEYYEKAAELDNVDGYCRAALYLANGYSGVTDAVKSREYYEKAAGMGSCFALVELSFLYENGNGVERSYEKAFELCEKAAQEGYPYAMFRVGLYLEKAVLGEAKPEEAFAWYTKAAMADENEGIFALGRCYKQGIGTEEDWDKALEWFGKGAEKNESRCLTELGLAYENGNGVEENPQKAVEYMTRAAEQDYGYAQFKMGDYYFFGCGPCLEDNKKAVEWYEKAVANEIPMAMLRMGDYYLYDYDSLNESEKAFAYFKKAAEYEWYNEGLGICYEMGIGVEDNEAEAFKYYTLAADNGNVTSMYRTGLCYYNGVGVKQNYAEAYRWFTDAAGNENIGAAYYLGKMQMYGEGCTPDPEAAVQWLLKAAEKNNDKAQFELGNAYLTGNGVEENDDIAMEWFEKAAENGNEKALKITGRRRK